MNDEPTQPARYSSDPADHPEITFGPDGVVTAYTMRLCGDCSCGPPCRCSSDPATVVREWISGGWVWVAHCTPEVSST